MKNSTFASFGNSIIASIIISQWTNNDKVESWRGEKMSEVEIILVEIVPISALYYKIHTISILQVRKLVVQVTSTSTIYKWRRIGPRSGIVFQIMKNLLLFNNIQEYLCIRCYSGFV